MHVQVPRPVPVTVTAQKYRDPLEIKFKLSRYNLIYDIKEGLKPMGQA